MWLFWIVLQILLLVLAGGLVRAALRRADDVVTAVIERIRNTTATPAVDTAPCESSEDSGQSQ